jgi:uncharacterized protein YqjF (DUF2071 family)
MKTLEVSADPDLGFEAPVKIRQPFMIHTWADLAFLHWPFEPKLLQALLPPSLQVDCFDGAAWVGLIPFRLSVRLPPFLPSIRGLSRTLEVNVRTYVRGPDGRRGIWFLSLDANCLPLVLITRVWYRIPYMWAGLEFRRSGQVVQYQSSRRLPRQTDADVRVHLLLESEADDLSPLEQFLTCRWRLYSPGVRGIMASQIDHPSWPLIRTRPLEIDSGLLAPLGLKTPSEPPMALFSPGVEVGWGRRHLASP